MTVVLNEKVIYMISLSRQSFWKSTKDSVAVGNDVERKTRNFS